jgi:hypothetical protein
MIPSAYKDGKLYSVRPVEQLGSELVTNGDFSSASDWTFSGGGVAISGGKLNFTATTREATQSISVVNTKTYRVSYEVSNYSAGSVRAEIGSSVGISRTANGIYSEYIVASGTNVIQIDAVSVFTGSIDNVSVKEVLVANGDFTFSRGSNLAATRVDVNGLIEKGRENLLLQSNQFDTTWSLINTSLTSGQASYDGSSDAWLLTKSASSGYIRQNNTTGGVQTYSVYAKANSLNWITIEAASIGNSYFNLANGVKGTSSASLIDANIEDVGGGWYRCSITYNTTISQLRIFPADGNLNVGGTSGSIYIQDAQLESGLVSTSVIKTGASTAQAGILEDMPRLDYSGGASCPSLLLESQRSNLVPFSEHLESSDWGKTRCTIEDNSTTSPEGVINASKMTSTDASESYIQDNLTTTGTKLTWSFFAKKGDLDYAHGLVWDLSANGCRQWFNLSTGAVGGTTTFGSGYSVDSATIEDYGNGWYRCAMVVNSTAGTQGCRVNISSADTTIGSAVNSYGYFYGLQGEDASYPTSYIPTMGSAVTRGKDVADGAGDADLFNDSQGVLFVEVSFARDRGKSSPFKVDRISLSDGTSNNRILISNTTTANQIQAFIRNSSGTIFNETITLTDITANNKIAVRYESGNYALYINGTEEATGTSTNVPSGLNELMFDGSSGNYEFEGKVKQTLYFPTALTDTELASLTTI